MPRALAPARLRGSAGWPRTSRRALVSRDRHLRGDVLVEGGARGVGIDGQRALGAVDPHPEEVVADRKRRWNGEVGARRCRRVSRRAEGQEQATITDKKAYELVAADRRRK